MNNGIFGFPILNIYPERRRERQHFLYQTRIGFGLAIAGTGMTQAALSSSMSDRISTLTFGSSRQYHSFARVAAIGSMRITARRSLSVPNMIIRRASAWLVNGLIISYFARYLDSLQLGASIVYAYGLRKAFHLQSACSGQLFIILVCS